MTIRRSLEPVGVPKPVAGFAPKALLVFALPPKALVPAWVLPNALVVLAVLFWPNAPPDPKALVPPPPLNAPNPVGGLTAPKAEVLALFCGVENAPGKEL